MSPLDQCRTHTITRRRVYTPLGFIMCPLNHCRTQVRTSRSVYVPFVNGG